MKIKSIYTASKVLGSIFFATYLVGCGDRVEVPPASVGKILTLEGYKAERKLTSKFRLDPCLFYCDKLVTLAVSDAGHIEAFKLFMPKDQLNMKFDVRMTISIRKTAIDSIFDRVPPVNNIIKPDIVYETYAKPIIRDVVRQVMAKYTINSIASSREAVSLELFQTVSKALELSPITVKAFGLADVQYPEVITTAKIKAAERREKIEEEKAQFEIQKVTMARYLEKEKMQRAIEREKAAGVKEVNEIYAKSVSDKFLSYKTLEVLSELAKSDNKVFIPLSALDSLGVQQALFVDQVRKDNGY
jgi:SPFH domain / Band 7 family